jgi:hypothetical protein
MRLRSRLSQRGFALSAAALAAHLTQDARAVVVSTALVDSTVRVATLVAAGSSLAGVVSTSVATLTQGVLKAMLLAKLKFALIGLAAVAIVSAGVLAQGVDPTRPTDNDRLKAVERKLDKLLEVLGGSSRRMPAPDAPPATTPIANGAAPSADGAPLMVPAPPNPPGVATAPPRFNPRPGPGPLIGLVAPRAGRADLASRVDLVEQRLSNLERRLSDLERRISSSHSEALLSPLPAAGAPAAADIPGATPAPPSIPRATPPPTAGDPHYNLPASSQPGADTAPSVPPSANEPLEKPARPDANPRIN